MLAASAGVLLWILSAGSRLSSNRSPVSLASPASGRVDILPHVLLALCVTIAAARLIGWLFRRIHQPAVVGEVMAGIALGPSLLGHISPATSAFLFPAEIGTALHVLAQIGIILFMFLVGLELDTDLLRRGYQSSIAISHASILVPFVLGSSAALWMYTRYAPAGVSFPLFSLFLGMSLSVTAFPVLARILTDNRMHRSEIGAVTLGCAAVDDVTAWCLLALLSGLARQQHQRAAAPFLLTLLFIGVVLAVRPVIHRAVRMQDERGPLTQSGAAIVFLALLVFTLTTEWIGIHALFGAFLFGAVIPHNSRTAAELRDKLEDTTVVLLLPVFFAFTGLRTQVALLSGWEHWAFCGLIVLLASAGKFGGSYVAARLTGLDRRDSASIGVLMNTRGLMELIVLNVGFDLGILSQTLFAMCVIMALITTAATAPLLHVLRRNDGVRFHVHAAGSSAAP